MLFFSFIFSKSKSRIVTMFDLPNPYEIVRTNINDQNDINILTDNISGLNFSSEHLILNREIFNVYIGGEFMLGRKSVSRLAFHSAYLMPALLIKDKTLLSARIGLTHLNTDDPDFLFKWNGYVASIGIEYQVTDEISIGTSYTLYDMQNKQDGNDDVDLVYEKIGLSIIYGFPLVNEKEWNEKN